MTNKGGTMLSIADINQTATNIARMWESFSLERNTALTLNQEARQYVFATDMDSTSAANLPHKNRTHQPKLTEISDSLQSEYWDAIFSTSQFFDFLGESDEDKLRARKIVAWMRSKLDTKEFRETTGRELINDFVIYGNAFLAPEYQVEYDDLGQELFKGGVLRRIPFMDMVFDPRATSFNTAGKIERRSIHLAELAELPVLYPNSKFDEAAIKKIVLSRHTGVIDLWTDILKESAITYDGYGDIEGYYQGDTAELLIYRGDIFNPDTGETQRNRVVYVVDRVHVIRNEPSLSPRGFPGVYHARWRIRPNNVWGQGPLDNLVGLQYRMDHLENLKADVFDLIANPVLKIKGTQVIEPQDGFAPGAVYYLGDEGDVAFMAPDVTALQADTQMALLAKNMEDYAGVPPLSRGIRSPGEKTAFEVDTLNTNASKKFVDKAKQFEIMITQALREMFELMLINFDGNDYVETFDDLEGKDTLQALAEEDVKARGRFTALGASHWDRKNKLTREMQSFQLGPAQDPKIRAHVNGFEMAKFYEEQLQLQDTNIIEQYSGVKEDVSLQAVAEAEKQKITQDTQTDFFGQQGGAVPGAPVQ